MAKKITVREFRQKVQKLIKEEKSKLQKNTKKSKKINESFIRSVIREEIEAMNESLSLQFDGGRIPMFKPNPSKRFVVSPVFQGKVIREKGSRARIELIASTDDYESKSSIANTKAIEDKAQEALMKYIRFGDLGNGVQGLYIDPRVTQGIPMRSISPEKVKTLKALYNKVKDSNPEQAQRIADAIQRATKKLRWTFTGKIFVPENVQI